MSIASDAAKIAADAETFHQIVHGTATDPDVTTEGGSVPTLAKVVKQQNATQTAIVMAMIFG